MQTMYERLQAHLTKHAYKRGANKGDAPLDSSRRGRSHERVSTRRDHMAVRFWNTDVIRAYPDGRIVLNCGGWYMSPTTKTCVNDALRWFGGNIAWLYSDRLYGKTQTVEEFEQIMATLPDWCADWPIKAAGGWRGKRYRKD